MNLHDHRTVCEDTVSFYVFDELRSGQTGISPTTYRYDTLKEAMEKFRELPAQYTTALGIHLPPHTEFDLMQRREGEHVLVTDYLNRPDWRTSPDVLSAVDTLCQDFRIQWQYDSKCLGTLILVPMERIPGYTIPDTAFNDKMLRPEEPLRYGQQPNPITAINEGFVPGQGWTDFQTLHAEAERFGYDDPCCVRVKTFNVNYTDANGHAGQADLRPMDLRILLDRYTLQYGEREQAKKLIDKLSHEISELLVVPGAARDDYARSLREDLDAGKLDDVVSSLELMRDHGETDRQRSAARCLLARCIGLVERHRSLLPDMCYSVMKSTGKLVVLKRGEEGCFSTSYNTPDPVKNKELADYLNEKLRVTPAQVQAMSVGSMFGWNTPGADPRTYERKAALSQQISGAESRRQDKPHNASSHKKDEHDL